MIPVVKPLNYNDDFIVKEKAYTDTGIIFNSPLLNNLKTPDEAILRAIEIIEEKNRKKKQLILD